MIIDPHSYEVIAQQNQVALQELTRAIVRSQDTFRLILLHCNYLQPQRQHQQKILYHLQTQHGIKIATFSLDEALANEKKSLDTFIQTFIDEKLAGALPQALLVTGLESLTSLDKVLQFTNQARDSLRRFPFPVLLWVNDEILRELPRHAPDFLNWAKTPIKFKIATEDLQDQLRQETDKLFECILNLGSGRFPRISHVELKRALAEFRERQKIPVDLISLVGNQPNLNGVLQSASDSQMLQASIQFALGFDAYTRIHQAATQEERTALLKEALQDYRQSLKVWRKQVAQHQADLTTAAAKQALERQCCVSFYMGLLWRRYALLHRAKYQRACVHAKNHYQECVEELRRGNRLDLAAKFINPLGEVLQRLAAYYTQQAEDLDEKQKTDTQSKADALHDKATQLWDQLETLVKEAIKLHKAYPDAIRHAQSYGLLAEVALARQQWQQAFEYANQAQKINDSKQFTSKTEERSWARPHYHNLYLLLQAQAETHFGQTKSALQKLRSAKQTCIPAYDPSLYIRILKALHDIYFEEGGKYLEAFQVKQEQRSIEQQYGLRAFTGPGCLEAAQHITNPALDPVDFLDVSNFNLTEPSLAQPGELAQEITASGRAQDLKRLLSDYLGRLDRKLIVIHGQSGVGKSSIINAGLVPSLKQSKTRQVLGTSRHILAVVLNVYRGDWSKELDKQLDKALEEQCLKKRAVPYLEKAEQPKISESQIQAVLARLSQVAGKKGENLAVLIFDQFEDFFFEQNELSKRNEFFDLLDKCLKIPYVKVVISLREDYLHHLLEYERFESKDKTNKVGNILDENKRFPLGNFSKEHADSVIRELTGRSPFSLSDDLIQQLVEDLADETGTVRPIELQVVGLQLQEKNISTKDQYQNLFYGDKANNTTQELVNPKAVLVRNFLDQVIKDCGPENKQTAELILSFLTEGNGNRPLKTLEELAQNLADFQFADPDIKQTKRNEDYFTSLPKEIRRKSELVLKILVASRLVLALPEDTDVRYRLVHDYLATIIRQLYSDLQAKIDALQKKNQFLETQLHQGKRQRRLIAGVAIVIGVVALILGELFNETQKQSRRASIAEIEANVAQSSTLLSSGNALDALLISIKAAERVKTIDAQTTEKTGIRLAALGQLQQTLYKVKERANLRGHAAGVTSISFSKDGQLMASASYDGTVRLWSANGKQPEEFTGHTNRVNSVSVSPDGGLIASASDDNTVRLWSRDKQWKKILTGHKNPVTSVSFSPDGELIASASDDHTVKLWSRDGQLITTLNVHSDRVRAVSFSPDGRLLASASWDGSVILWTRKGQKLKPWKTSGKLAAVSFSSTGNILATGDLNGIVKLWNVDGQILQTFPAQAQSIASISFSPDDTMLAVTTVDENSPFKLWKRQSIDLKAPGFRESEFKIKGAVIAKFGPDSTLAVAETDNAIHLWNLKGFEPEVLPSLNEPVTSMSVSHASQQLVQGSKGQLIFWDLNGKQLHHLKAGGSVDSLDFSQDGRVVVGAVNTDLGTTAKPGEVVFWSGGGQELRRFHVADKVKKVSLSPDGRRVVAVVSRNTHVQLNSATDKTKPSSKEHVVVLDSDTGETKNSFPEQDTIQSISFSPDGKTVAVGKPPTDSKDDSLTLWSLEGEKLPFFPEGNTNSFIGINSVSFSPDGKLLAWAGINNTIRRWNWKEKKLLKSLEGHINKVNTVSFSPDSKILVSADDEGEIKIWDAEKGKLLATFQKDSKPVDTIQFDPAGTTIVSASLSKNSTQLDGTTNLTSKDESTSRIVMWNFNVDEVDSLLQQACRLLGSYSGYNEIEGYQGQSEEDHAICRDIR